MVRPLPGRALVIQREWKVVSISASVERRIGRAAPEHHRYDVHRDLVDEPECQRLPADIAGCDGNVAVAGEFLGDRDRAAYVVDELAGRLGMPALRPRPVCHNHDVFAGRRSAFPPVGRVEEVSSHDDFPICCHIGRT